MPLLTRAAVAGAATSPARSPIASEPGRASRSSATAAAIVAGMPIAERVDDEAVGAPVPVGEAEGEQNAAAPQPISPGERAPCPTAAHAEQTQRERGRDDRDHDRDDDAQHDHVEAPTPTTITITLTIRPGTAARRRRRGAGRCGSRTSRTSSRARLERERAVGVEDRATRGVRTVERERVGHAAAGEQVVAGAAAGRGGSCSGRSKRRMPTSSLGTSRRARRRAQSSRGSSVASTASVAGPVGVEPERAAVRARSRTPPSSQPAGSVAMHGTDVADGTDWAMRIITSLGAARRRAVDLEVVRPACSRFTISRDDDERAEQRAPAASTTRFALQRWSEIGRRSGASARNCASRSRPSCFIAVRSCVGLATPRAAANASAISSGVK